MSWNRHGLLFAASIALGAIANAQEPAVETPAAKLADETSFLRVRSFIKDGNTLDRALRPLVRESRRAVFEVREQDARTLALATLIDSEGHLVTKASLLTSENTLRDSDGKDYAMRVLAIDDEFDLAVLEIEADALPGLELHGGDQFVAGQFLVAVSGRSSHPLGVGILSVLPRLIPAESGFLGVSFEDQSGVVRITQVVPESAAARTGIQINDILRALDDVDIATGTEFQRTIARKAPGTRVRLRIQRGADTLDFNLALGARESTQPENLEGERSIRRSGFPKALQHDMVIAPWQCGGPLLDLEGRCVAINIARAGRTTSLAIPAGDVDRIVQKLLVEHAATKAGHAATKAGIKDSASQPDAKSDATKRVDSGKRGG